MAIIDWEIMNNGLNEVINNGIVLYGASSLGEKTVIFLKELGLDSKIIAVVDSDDKKWGKEWMKYQILSPSELKNISSNGIIVITSIYLKEITNFLQDKIKCLQKICSVFSLKSAVHYDIMNNNASYIINEFVDNYKEKYILWKNSLILRRDIIRQKCFLDMIKCISENPISILLCGIQKTGNTTLKESFSNSKIKNFVFTYHLSYCDNKKFKIAKEFLKYFNTRQIKIIFGVREPIERIISQKWEKVGDPYLHNDKCFQSFIDNKYEEFIDDLMLSEKDKGVEFNCGKCFYADIADWCEDQIEKLFGINVFEYTFDKDKGYLIIKKNNVSIFIYRLDKLSKLEKEIGIFVGDSSFILKKANMASEKRYRFAYEQYLEQISIKKSFFDSLVCSKGMTHFYTEEECKNYRKKWEGRLI